MSNNNRLIAPATAAAAFTREICRNTSHNEPRPKTYARSSGRSPKVMPSSKHTASAKPVSAGKNRCRIITVSHAEMPNSTRCSAIAEITLVPNVSIHGNRTA